MNTFRFGVFLSHLVKTGSDFSSVLAVALLLALGTTASAVVLSPFLILPSLACSPDQGVILSSLLCDSIHECAFFFSFLN